MHGLAVGLVTIALLTESDLPFLLVAGLFGILGVWLLVRGPVQRRRIGVLVVVASLLLGYLAWGRGSGTPRTRREVTEAFAKAFVEADWGAARELMVPSARALSEPIFLGFGKELRALGVRVGECRDEGWQTGCALDGGTQYQGAIMMSLSRTEEGWRVDSFLPMGGPTPPGEVMQPGGAGGAAGSTVPLSADPWMYARFPAAAVLLVSLYRARRPVFDRVLACSACALIAVTAGPASSWGTPLAFVQAVPLLATGRIAAAALLGHLAVGLQGLLGPTVDRAAVVSSPARYLALWVGVASAGLAAQWFPRQAGAPLVPGLLVALGLAVSVLGRRKPETS